MKTYLLYLLIPVIFVLVPYTTKDRTERINTYYTYNKSIDSLRESSLNIKQEIDKDIHNFKNYTDSIKTKIANYRKEIDVIKNRQTNKLIDTTQLSLIDSKISSKRKSWIKRTIAKIKL